MNNKKNSQIEIFCSYSHKDEDLKNRLDAHLSALKREGYADLWHDRKIRPGEEWEKVIDNHINKAQIILLLISADFIASDYCYGAEMGIALKRYAKKDAIVVPIIIKPVDWEFTQINELEALPKDGKPIITWTIQDEAWAEIAKEIRKIVEDLKMKDSFILKEAAFSAGSPKYVVNDQITDMAVAPYIKNGIAYLPVRHVCQALEVKDSNILWDAVNKKITLLMGDRVVQLTIGSKNMIVNGASIEIDAEPMIVDNMVMLPIRCIAQALGITVSWDQATMTVRFVSLVKKTKQSGS